VYAQDGAAVGRLGVEPDDGPLFSAKAGSSLASQVRGFCHLMRSAFRIRRTWLRLIGTPSAFSAAASRSSVQWQVGGAAPSAGSGGRPRALAITRPRLSSVYVGGRPGRGASSSPSKPAALKRSRRARTVLPPRPTPRAI